MSLDVFKLDGRVALITGGNRGLGFAMAQALAEAGADVVVTSRQQEKALESAAALAGSTGRRTLGLVVNVTCSRAVARYMKEQHYGRVINIASMIALVALPERSAYCSSKGGLIQLTRVLALEWAPYNITVNALCPGPLATEMNISVMNNPQANQFFLDHIPLGRWGRPEELGGAIVFLASHASSFMTGAALVIDGGWTAG